MKSLKFQSPPRVSSKSSSKSQSPSRSNSHPKSPSRFQDNEELLRYLPYYGENGNVYYQIDLEIMYDSLYTSRVLWLI